MRESGRTRGVVTSRLSKSENSDHLPSHRSAEQTERRDTAQSTTPAPRTRPRGHGPIAQITLLEIRGELRLLAKDVAILYEEDRNRCHRERQEAQERAGPLNAELVVHLGGEKRELDTSEGARAYLGSTYSCSKERTENSRRGERGGGGEQVNVDEVVEETDEEADSG